MPQDDSSSLSAAIMSTTRSLEHEPEEQVLERLTALITQLIQKDFEALVRLLYRIDVSEQKVRTKLAEKSGQDSAAVIARLILERQLEKMKSRNSYPKKDNGGDEERW